MADEQEIENDGVLEIPSFSRERAILVENTHSRDAVRSTLARRLLWLVSLIYVVVLGAAISGYLDVQNSKDLIALIATPITSIFATVIGFYFGSEDRSSSKR